MTSKDARVLRLAVWLPGLAVAVGAAVVTAHGLFEVAAAAGVPSGVAWLYPLITDGLALVAYASTARLNGSARRYAWTVVVLAAGLSGLAQASYLAGGVDDVAPKALRFGVGAWPAAAAAVVAHLLYLLASDALGRPTDRPAVRALVSDPPPVIDPSPTDARADTEPPAVDAPARERARASAERHADRHGALPTVRRLMELADVSRGTAGDALKSLRNRPEPLHLIDTDKTARTER